MTATPFHDAQGPVVTVTVNPAVDVFVPVELLQPGSLHRISGMVQQPGGKGINVAKALRALGVPAVATGFLGGNRGRWIREALHQAGLVEAFVEIDGETRMNIKITEGSGRLTELNAAGPALADADWAALEEQIEALTETATSAEAGTAANGSIRADSAGLGPAVLALCGNLPQAAPADWYRRQIERAKRRGVPTVLDASGVALIEGVKAGPDLIKPNLRELADLVGTPLPTPEAALRAARSVMEKHGVGAVVVSMGGDGLVAAVGETAWRVEVPRVTVVSAVGAGDTVIAGLLHALRGGLAWPESLRFAAAAGTAAVRKGGNQQPDPSEISNLLPQVRVERMEVSV
jgi:fructose-1-phosphate kinase PfkB-like protein